MFRLTNWVIGIAVATISISLWAYINRPQILPDWPERVTGFAFSPYHSGQDPREHIYPSLEQIDSDLSLLAGKVTAVRTYSVEGSLAEIPRLARKHNINVCLGAYLSYEEGRNAEEFPQFLKIAKSNRNVVRAIVGNETQLQGILDYDDLISYLDQARLALGVPVSTAEPAGIWHKTPELVEHVDFIAMQILPYWQSMEVHVAVDYVFNELKGLQEAYPGKPIIISEVGWPSHGRDRGAAVASVSNEATFLRLFLKRVSEDPYIYYLMEAFDQPWKTDIEGAVGAYWGVYDVDRNPKFEFTQPIVPVPEWELLAGISLTLAFITFGLLLIDSKTLRGHGRSFLAIVSYLAATAIVWIVYEYSSLYQTVGTIIIGILMAVGMIGIFLVLMAEAHEWAEAIWIKERRRYVKITSMPDDDLPMVSIHVPAYNEPSTMLIRTLNGLAKLDYPNYEVLVIDNNTKDPAVWQPVRAHCEKLGERFRFFHKDPLQGFKAGALNFGLEQTSADAEIIAVIDSDYIVDPGWLRDLMPQFSEPKVAIVQAPQDYSDGCQNAFKAMCYSEYAGFFYIGMMTRNERNAIIQHGTMTMVRKEVMEEVGGWSEWCITEDAELGLRIFELGYEAHYIPHSYGRGVMPDTFLDYKKQRFRWAYGAMQILKHHICSLFNVCDSRLTPGQRYHFIAGWLPWLADGFNLLFNLAAIGWSLAMVWAPKMIDPPMLLFSLLPVALFMFKTTKLIYIYKSRIGASTLQTVFGGLAGLSLAHTISRAILQGLFTKGMPFIRTPKHAEQTGLRSVIASTREEMLLLIALWSAAYAIVIIQGVESADTILWIVVLLIQSITYLAALIVAVVAAMPEWSARLIGVREIERPEKLLSNTKNT
jgi:cellulose synthase/poly-beta-1,6-N-acetylglucosamine synthase-like glycosyltransferase/exo-beta-1,3-glucanase (GH17 family)